MTASDIAILRRLADLRQPTTMPDEGRDAYVDLYKRGLIDWCGSEISLSRDGRKAVHAADLADLDEAAAFLKDLHNSYPSIVIGRWTCRLTSAGSRSRIWLRAEGASSDMAAVGFDQTGRLIRYQNDGGRAAACFMTREEKRALREWSRDPATVEALRNRVRSTTREDQVTCEID